MGSGLPQPHHHRGTHQHHHLRDPGGPTSQQHDVISPLIQQTAQLTVRQLHDSAHTMHVVTGGPTSQHCNVISPFIQHTAYLTLRQLHDSVHTMHVARYFGALTVRLRHTQSWPHAPAQQLSVSLTSLAAEVAPYSSICIYACSLEVCTADGLVFPGVRCSPLIIKTFGCSSTTF